MYKKEGFMMMEVLVAIFILMITTVTIINIQFRALYRAADDRDEIMHLFKLKKTLYSLLLFPEKKAFKKKIIDDEAALTIIKEQRPIEQKSSLFPLSKQLEIVTVDGSWKFTQRNRSARLAGIIYQYHEDQKRA